MGSQRVGYDWATNTFTFVLNSTSLLSYSSGQKSEMGQNQSVGRAVFPSVFGYKKRQSTLVFLPGESHGQRSLVGCSPRGHKESDTTKRLRHTHNLIFILFFSIKEYWTLCLCSSQRESVPCLFWLLQAAPIPWLIAPSPLQPLTLILLLPHMRTFVLRLGSHGQPRIMSPYQHLQLNHIRKVPFATQHDVQSFGD